VQGILFGLVLQFPKTPLYTKNNRFLAAFILLLSIIGLDELLEVNGINDQFYLLELLGSDVPWYMLVYVPMFIYFLKSAKHPWANSSYLKWLVFPFLLYLFFNFIIDLQVDFHLMDWTIIKKWQIPIYNSEYFLSMVYASVLCVMAYWVIAKSTVSLAEKKWLRSIWLFNLAILLIWMISEFMPDEIYNNWNGEVTYPVWITVSLFVTWLSFKGLFQLELAQDKQAIHQLLNGPQKGVEAIIPINNSITASKSSTSLSAYYESFLQLMTCEKLYLNPNLSREDIAQKLGISPSYLTQIIKTHTEQNLTSVVNQYRVAAVKQMLENEKFQQFSILAIGMEAGFKSKSAFYDSFKKETGLTPNQYKIRFRKS
jgi:AraC-like DNA-binding protein